MNVSADTKVHDLLTEYPYLKAWLVSYAPEFEKLGNPVVYNTVGRVATLEAAARMGQLRAVLTAYAFDGSPPERVLDRVAARAEDLLDVQMATVLVLVYDPRERAMTVASDMPSETSTSITGGRSVGPSVPIFERRSFACAVGS